MTAEPTLSEIREQAKAAKDAKVEAAKEAAKKLIEEAVRAADKEYDETMLEAYQQRGITDNRITSNHRTERMQ